jgi:hypothetical protein
VNQFRSTTTPGFRDCFSRLPAEIQIQAAKQYAWFSVNPKHPSLRLKQIDSFWSVRITRSYRALATPEWIWLAKPLSRKEN